MDLCSYFRCRDGQHTGAIIHQIQAHAGGFTFYPLQTIQVTANVAIDVATWYRRTLPGDPEWLDFVQQFINGQQLRTQQRGRSHSALMLVRHSNHHYILTFGVAHTIAKKLELERRFGKIALSNGKLQDEVRGISAKVYGTHGKIRTERRGRGGPTRELEVPRQANMTSGLAAKIQLHGTEHISTGDVGFKTIAATDAHELVANLDQLEAWWNAGAEADQTLASLDRIFEVRDPLLLTQLDGMRTGDMQANIPGRFSLCLDHEQLWDAIQIDYIVNRQRLNLAAPDEAYILGALHYASQQGVDPLRVNYEAIIPPQNHTVGGRLADNLAFETVLPNSPDTFIYESAGWFQAKAGWRQEVTNDVTVLMQQSIPLMQNIALPNAANARETEIAYMNRTMANAVGAQCLMLHGQWPQWQQLELCDICHNGTTLMFLKRGSGREACGDVVQQAINTAMALTDPDGQYLQWANAQLAPRGWGINIAQRANITFCVVLITANQNRLPTAYTVRSMDALSNHLREIGRLGFTPALKVV